jgi:hypothetical protein
MEIQRKIGRKIAKQNELGFQEMAVILSPLVLYGGNGQTKLPLRPKTKIHASQWALWESSS